MQHANWSQSTSAGRADTDLYSRLSGLLLLVVALCDAVCINRLWVSLPAGVSPYSSSTSLSSSAAIVPPALLQCRQSHIHCLRTRGLGHSSFGRPRSYGTEMFCLTSTPHPQQAWGGTPARAWLALKRGSGHWGWALGSPLQSECTPDTGPTSETMDRCSPPSCTESRSGPRRSRGTVD